MPVVEDIGDGSQDACLVRVRAGRWEGWGECEAAPLPTIAAFVAPMSHSACKPVRDSVLGQDIEEPDDIRRINAAVRANSLDLLQSDHALSGIDIALWDLLGRRREEPVWKLLGWARPAPKLPYASALFGETPQATAVKAEAIRAAGFRAAKFGWGPFGRGTVAQDRNQVLAARSGLGEDAVLLIDAGTVWVEDVEQARRRLKFLQDARVLWLEEPFVSGALHAYRELAAEAAPVKLAAGEGAHHPHQARALIDHGGVGYIQIDTGRVGGISSAKDVADHARQHHVTYVNHTFTSHLALSASLQPYAGLERAELCEVPFEAKLLAAELTRERLEPDAEGMIRAPDAPGLGVRPDPAAIRKYLVNAELRVNGRVLYRPPAV